MNQNFLQQIGDVSSKVFFAYHIESNQFQFLSKAAEQIWNADLQSLTQNPAIIFHSLQSDDLKAVETHYRELQQGKSKQFECRIHPEPDKKKVLSVDAYAVKEPEGTVTVIAGIVEDITKEEEYKEYLLEFGRRKNTALEIVAHDLRGPLSIVRSVSDAMEKGKQGLESEDVLNFTSFINRACETCINLINNLLSDEHLKSQDITVLKERTDVIFKVREAVKSYSFSDNIKNEFRIETEADKLFVEIDIVKFDQIINNLISNAIKFSKPNSPITISVKQERGYVIITCADEGIGIPDELKPFVFDRYTKASRPGLQGEQSRGIGLSIVRNLVEIQGGHIYFESEENIGTTFYITFPLK